MDRFRGTLQGTPIAEAPVRTALTVSQTVLGPFLDKVPIIAEEVLLALLPIFLIFMLLQRVSFRLSRKNVSWIIYGLLLTYLGLFLFLLGAQGGFMEVGRTIGFNVASLDNKLYLLVIGFVLGLVTVLAEPAVHVLTHQIEDITNGAVKGMRSKPFFPWASVRPSPWRCCGSYSLKSSFGTICCRAILSR